MTDVELAIRLTTDADEAGRKVEGVGDSFGRMAAEVDDATRKADAAGSRLDSVGEKADEMGSKSSQAAGGMGDLGGALSLMPGPLGKVGAGMEAVAPAIQGVTGASDLLNLVTQSNIVVQTRQRAATIASAIAQKTVAAATRTWAAVQWALNAALNANPIGIAVAAIALLVAGVVLAYRRSEKFRAVVQAVMGAARRAVESVVKVLGSVVTWVRDKIPAAFSAMRDRAAAIWRAVQSVVSAVAGRIVAFVVNARDRVVNAWQAVKDRGAAAFDAVRDKVAAIMDKVASLVQGARDKVSDAVGGIKDAFHHAFDAVLDFIQPIIDKVEWILDKLSHLPHIPGFGRAVVPGSVAAPAAPAGSSGGGDTFNFYFPNAYVASEDQLARAVTEAVTNRNRLLGAG